MTVSPFWITGLPRSRTAWFAKAMSASRSVCAHELTSYARDFAHFKVLWLEGPETYRGNADSACGLHITRIIDEIAPRTLVIERPVAEVVASCRRLLNDPLPGLDAALEQLQEALTYEHPLIKRVRFSDLTDRHCLIEAAEWLIAGSGERAAELMDVNIQVATERLQHLFDTPHTLWHLNEAA